MSGEAASLAKTAPRAAPAATAGLKTALLSEARSAGFAEAKIARPGDVRDAGARLRAWLAEGRHGEMGYMSDRADWRADPETLWPKVRSIIMLAENYGPAADPRAMLGRADRGAISCYAQGGDYHDLVKKRLKRLGRWLLAHPDAPPGAEIKVFVDTAPVMEKPLAEAAGLGWIGKHTNLLSRRLGNWFFLGAIFTSIDFPADGFEGRHCGDCRRCLDVCPTAAFPAPFQLDARRCISYLTIELKGPIPREFRAPIGNRIYGCDDCLAVCPWNKFAETAAEAGYWARVELRAPRLDHLAGLTDPMFREVFAGSPIKRIGRARFVRNVLIAIGNSKTPALTAAAEALLDDPEPLVRGASVWATARLAPERLASAAARRIAQETDADVLEEWRAEGFAAPR